MRKKAPFKQKELIIKFHNEHIKINVIHFEEVKL